MTNNNRDMVLSNTTKSPKKMKNREILPIFVGQESDERLLCSLNDKPKKYERMKKILLLLLTSILVAMCASAQVLVCGSYLEDGQVNSPYIMSGTVTWNSASHTLTLDNAVIDYSSNNPQDGISPIRVTRDATIVVRGNCRLSTTGYVAIAADSYNPPRGQTDGA